MQYDCTVIHDTANCNVKFKFTSFDRYKTRVLFFWNLKFELKEQVNANDHMQFCL